LSFEANFDICYFSITKNKLRFSLYLLVIIFFLNLQALPEDLKTKLSIDEELVASPKQYFSGISSPKPAAKPKYSKR